MFIHIYCRTFRLIGFFCKYMSHKLIVLTNRFYIAHICMFD